MRVRRAILTVACTGVSLTGAHLARAQEASSANLPDQFQPGEMIQIQKPKKAGSNSQSLATAPKQNTAPVAEQPATSEELPPLIVPSVGIEGEATPVPAATASSQDLSHSLEQRVAPEGSPRAIAPARRPQSKKRPPRHVEQQMAGVSAPIPMSLSVAQAMAITAPLPEYPYEAKRRNLTGSGICVVTVDVATGRVTDARMDQSTGSAMLDKLTIQTFKSWRFKAGTVSQVRVPISYD